MRASCAKSRLYHFSDTDSCSFFFLLLVRIEIRLVSLEWLSWGSVGTETAWRQHTLSVGASTALQVASFLFSLGPVNQRSYPAGRMGQIWHMCTYINCHHYSWYLYAVVISGQGAPLMLWWISDRTWYIMYQILSNIFHKLFLAVKNSSSNSRNTSKRCWNG